MAKRRGTGRDRKRTETGDAPEWLGDQLDRMDEEMRLRGFSRQTRRLYGSHVKRFYLGRTSADPNATTEEMRSWLLRLMREGCSYSYVNQAVSALKFLHSKVLRRGVAKLELPRPRRDKSLPKVLSRDEVRRLIDAVTNLKHRAMLLVLYSGGLRVGEVIRLQVTDIESDRGMIRVRKGKGRKDRYVMLSAVTLEALRDYARPERLDKWLFPGERPDRHYNARSLQRVVKKAAERARIRRTVTPHILRHSFATHLVESGTQQRYIQQLLGHAKSATTEIYTHVANQALVKVISPADTLFGGPEEKDEE